MRIAKLPGYPFIGNVLEFRRDVLGTYQKIATLGDIVEIKFPGVRGIFINKPEHLKYVLSENQKNYRKSFFYDPVKIVLGNGLLNSEGKLWRQQRQMAQPAFRHKRLKELTQIMVQQIEAMLNSWEKYHSGQPFDIYTELSQVTLQIVVQTMFHVDIHSEMKAINQLWDKINHELGRRFWDLVSIPMWVPTPRNRKFAHAIQQLDKIIYNLMTKREKTDNQVDLFSMLNSTVDTETGKTMSRTQLRDEIVTMFLAGHETSSTALSWTFYLLAKHPEIEAKLRQEVDNVLGRKTPCFKNLAELKYTKMVIEEAMRLYPPVWGISRQALQEDEIGGHKISPNSLVSFSQYTMHRNPEYWKNPESFDPDAHFSDEERAKRPRYTYFPFGGGGRLCIGNHFAMMEMQLLLAMTMQKYKWTIIDSSPIKTLPLATLKPAKPIQIVLQQIA